MKDELLADEVALEGDRAGPALKPRRPRKGKPAAGGDYEPYVLPPGELGPGRHVVLVADVPWNDERPLNRFHVPRVQGEAVQAYGRYAAARDRGDSPEDVAALRDAWDRAAVAALKGVCVVPVRACVYLDPDGVVRYRAPGPDGAYRVVHERMPTAEELERAGAPDRARALRPLVEQLPVEVGDPRDPA